MRAGPPRIGILSTFGRSTHSMDFLNRLVVVEASLAETVHVIAPDAGWEPKKNVVFHRVRYQVGNNPLAQILNQARSQIRMSFLLARLSRQVDQWVFYGGDVLLLPCIVARLSGTMLLVALAGNLEKEARLKKRALGGVEIVFRRIVLGAAHKIVLYTETLVREWDLERYRAKIAIADSHYLDFHDFRVQRPVEQRGKVVGYVGRLSEEKGIMNFAEAIPRVLAVDPTIRFIIVGGGPLQSALTSYIAKNGLEKRVELAGLVPSNRVPQYLNEFSLCVLPSYTEGMPNIVLEAMACGTPVLATPVGAISDLIADGLTGFIMGTNSPDCIARSILAAISYPGLAAVAENARVSVERRFSFQAARESYRRMLALTDGRSDGGEAYAG